MHRFCSRRSGSKDILLNLHRRYLKLKKMDFAWRLYTLNAAWITDFKFCFISRVDFFCVEHSSRCTPTYASANFQSAFRMALICAMSEVQSEFPVWILLRKPSICPIMRFNLWVRFTRRDSSIPLYTIRGIVYIFCEIGYKVFLQVWLKPNCRALSR